jgi:hypothetical protein
MQVLCNIIKEKYFLEDIKMIKKMDKGLKFIQLEEDMRDIS